MAYNFEEFKTWINEEKNRQIKESWPAIETSITVLGQQKVWEKICRDIRDSWPISESASQSNPTSWVISRWMLEVDAIERTPISIQAKLAEVEQETELLQQEKANLEENQQTQQANQNLADLAIQLTIQELTNLKQTKETNKKPLKDRQKELGKEIQESMKSATDLSWFFKERFGEGERKNASKRELNEEQKKLREAEIRLRMKISENRQKEQSIKELEANLANSQRALKETNEQLRESQSKIINLETQILNYEQLKVKHEEKVAELSQELAELQTNYQTSQEVNVDFQAKLSQLEANLADFQQKNDELIQNQQATQISLQTKQEQLKKAHLEIASLQNQLKKARERPEPTPPESQPNLKKYGTKRLFMRSIRNSCRSWS